MSEKNTFRNFDVRKVRAYQKSSIASNSILYMGVFLAIAALIYMIINLEKADSIIRIWLPFMIASIILVLISQLIKKEHKKT